MTRGAARAGVAGDQRGFAYMLAPQHVAVGDAVRSGPSAPIRPGSSLQLRHIPDGQQARRPALARPARVAWLAVRRRAA
jgi:ribosomal protein L2